MASEFENGGELRICEPVYAELLSRRLPRSIASAEQHQRALAEVSELMARGLDRSPEQTELLKLLVILVPSVGEVLIVSLESGSVA